MNDGIHYFADSMPCMFQIGSEDIFRGARWVLVSCCLMAFIVFLERKKYAILKPALLFRLFFAVGLSMLMAGIRLR